MKKIILLITVLGLFCGSGMGQTCPPNCPFVVNYYSVTGIIPFSTTGNTFQCGQGIDVNTSQAACAFGIPMISAGIYDAANNLVSWSPPFSTPNNADNLRDGGIMTFPQGVVGTFYLKYTWGLGTQVCGTVSYPITINCNSGSNPCPNCTLAGNLVVTPANTNITNLSCGMTIPIACGSRIDGTITQRCNNTNINFPGNGVIRKQPGNIFVATVPPLLGAYTFSTTGNYTLTYPKSYANGTACGDSCTINFNVTGPCGGCAPWLGKGVIVYNAANPLNEDDIDNLNTPCNSIINAALNDSVLIFADRGCINTSDSRTNYLKITAPNSVPSITTFTANPNDPDNPDGAIMKALKITVCGTYTVEMWSKCGTTICDTCKYTINVNCNTNTPTSYCEGNNAFQISYNYSLPTGTALTDYKIKLEIYQNGSIINCPVSSGLVKTSPLDFTSYTGNIGWYVSSVTCPQFDGSRCLDYRIIITKQVSTNPVVIQTIGAFGTNGVTAGMNNDICCGTPPCCPTVGIQKVNNGGHCAMKDTIKNVCNKNIVSWTLNVNGNNYSDLNYPLTPQTIAANATVITGIIGLISLPPTNISLVYTFTYADGTTCRVTKQFNAANCVVLPLPCPTCTIASTATFQGQTINLNSSTTANPAILKCNKTYTLSNTVNCTPTQNYSFKGAYVSDNFNQNWPVTFNNTGTQLLLPSNMIVGRLYTLTLTWNWIRAVGDTCWASKNYPFRIDCSPCGSVCTPMVDVLSNGTTFTLTAGGNYSNNFDCNTTYNFVPNINCVPANAAITINQIKVFDLYSNPILNPAPWLQSFINNNGVGNMVIPVGINGMYKIRYYYGNSSIPACRDSFTCVLNINCTDCTACDYGGSVSINGISTNITNGIRLSIECNQTFDGSIKKDCNGVSTLLNNYVVKKLPGNNIIATLSNGFTHSFTTVGNYSVTYYNLNANGVKCDSLIVYFNVTCTPCGDWIYKGVFVQGDADPGGAFNIPCGTTKNTTIGKIIYTTAARYCDMPVNNQPPNQISVIRSIITNPANQIVSNKILTEYDGMDSIKTDTCGRYKIQLISKCGNRICDTCTYFVDIPCVRNPPPCRFTANAGPDKTICLGTSTTIGTTVLIPTGEVYTWASNPVSTITNAIMPTVSPSVTTTYYLTVTKQGCPTKKDTVIVTVNNCPPPTCNTCDTKLTGIKRDTLVPYQGITSLVEAFTFNNLPANITEVRATVTNFSLTSVDATGNINDECTICNTNPASWASVFGGEKIDGIKPKVNINGIETVGPVTLPQIMPNKNPRHVVWSNNGAVLNVPNTIKVGFILPAKSTLSCCTNKANICVKFVFRNDKCEECIVYKCFDVVIDK